MKSKSFFEGLSWLLVLNLVVKPVWIFAIDRQVQNLVGHEAYGTYFSLLNLALVLSFLADAGLSNMVTRAVAEKQKLNTRHLLKLKIFLLLLFSATCCLIAWLSRISAWDIMLYVIVIQALGSLFLFLRSLLVAQQLFKTDAVFSIADKTLMILLCGLFLYGINEPLRIETFLRLQIFSTAGACLFLFLLLLREKMIHQGTAEKTSKIIKSTVPFAVIILLMSMHYRLDGFLLERMRSDGATQAGIYATAFRLLDAGNMIGYLTASFLVAFVARNKENTSLVSSVVKRLQNALLLVAIAASCFVIVFPIWIQTTLYNTSDSYNTTVFQLCLAVLPAYYLVHLYGSLLTAAGRYRVFISILSVSVFTNIILNFFLITELGAVACCIAALVSQYGCAIACYFTASRSFSFSIPSKTWFGYLGLAVLFLLFFWLLKMAIPSVWIILAVVALLSIIVAAARMKSYKSFLQSLIQQKNA